MKLKEEMVVEEEMEVEMELQISDYFFHDRSGRSVSFAILPFVFHEDENTSPVPALKGQVFLRGNCSSSLRWVLKAVVAWKLDLNAIYVLSSGGQWMRISKPIKTYKNGEARPILIAVRMLQYIRRKPGSSMIKLLIHLNRVLRLEAKPTMEDFDEHMVLIKKIFNTGKVLRKSKISGIFLKEGTMKEIIDEDTFVADGAADEGLGDDDTDSSDEETERDLICSICDRGDNILSYYFILITLLATSSSIITCTLEM